eukprot:3778079-Rhodomonas_salina.4
MEGKTGLEAKRKGQILPACGRDDRSTGRPCRGPCTAADRTTHAQSARAAISRKNHRALESGGIQCRLQPWSPRPTPALESGEIHSKVRAQEHIQCQLSAGDGVEEVGEVISFPFVQRLVQVLYLAVSPRQDAANLVLVPRRKRFQPVQTQIAGSYKRISTRDGSTVRIGPNEPGSEDESGANTAVQVLVAAYARSVPGIT